MTSEIENKVSQNKRLEETIQDITMKFVMKKEAAFK
jgi:hypothetical protein